MKLRQKTLIIIGVAIACIIVILQGISDTIMLQGVGNIEQKTTRQNAERLLDALSHELAGLDTTAFDWAAWDDTYTFIQSNNTDYIESNLVDETFINLRLNFMLFINSSGQIVFSKVFDLLNKREMPIQQSLLEQIATNSFLLHHENTESSINGIILLPEGPVLVVSRPIVTSQGEGPIRGTLIIGRFLDDAEFSRLFEITHLPIVMQVLDGSQMSSDFQVANSSLSKEETIFVQPLNKETIAGYVLLEDVYGSPILILRFDMPRDFYAQGRASVVYVIFALVAVCVVFGGVTIVLLEKFVLSSLSRLSKDVGEIGKSGDFTARVSATEKDELSDLADEINRMLSALGQAEEKLSTLNFYGRRLNVAKNMEEIYRLTLDAMQKVLGFEYADLMMIDRGMLCIVDQRGYPKPFPLELPLDGSKRGITIKVVKTGNSVLVPDVRKDKDFVEGLSGVLSELAVPIRVGHKILGVLNVESKELNAFDEKDQKLLEILASHAATAISNLEHGRNLEAYAREIRESREKFERLFMDNPEAAVYVDPNFRILDVNPRFGELFGFSLDEIKGKQINDVVVPKDKMEEAEILDRKSLKGYFYHETIRKRKDGSLVPVSISVAPITVEGKIIGSVGLYRDITEMKSYEERLSALNIHGRKLNTAESIEEIYGLTMDAVEKTLGFEIAFFMVVDKGMLCLVDRRGYPESFSIKLPLDGTKRGVSVKVAKTGRSINVPDAEKEHDWVEFMPDIRSGLDVPVKIGRKVLGVIGVDSKKLNAFDEKDQELLEILASHAATAMSNLEHAKNLEAYAREIQESQQKFERLFMNNPEAAVYMDSGFQILEINPRFTELFGYSLDEVKGKHIDDIVVPEDKLEEAKMLGKKFLKEYAYHDTVRKRKDGALVPVSISGGPIIIEGKLIGTVGLYKDITERKQMEKKLEEYSQHLEELVEKRTRQLKEAQEQLIKSERLATIGQVAAMVGHDLRNPLTGIKGATYYLKTKLGPKMDERAREMLELIEKDVEHSNEIITDLMEYSKEIRLELTETTPKSIVREALSLVEVPENVQVLDLTQSEPRMKMDSEKMKRVFDNLVKNAVDAMPDGGKLTITSRESDGHVEIAFADAGIGMTKEIMEKIWTPFFTTKSKGMGLGLSVCKRIVEAHGGSISVESTVGKGTAFTVTIPIEPKIKEGGEKLWVNVPESLLSTTTKA